MQNTSQNRGAQKEKQRCQSTRASGPKQRPMQLGGASMEPRQYSVKLAKRPNTDISLVKETDNVKNDMTMSHH